MVSSILDKGIEDLTNLTYECECGNVHKVQIKKVVIEEGALYKTYNVIKDLSLGEKGLLVADNNTFEAAGRALEEDLEAKGLNIKKSIFNMPELHADEKAIGKVLIDIEDKTEFLIAVGSGTINDIVRFISYKLNIPYIIVGTAPSMDGYASTVSPLMVDGFKITYSATYPTAIIGDLNVLKKAPDNMVAAGFGDMLGKITALSDWILANSVCGEYYCQTIAKLMERAVKKCVHSIQGLSSRENSAIRDLTEGLILSGIAMQMMGNSRPASGAEHHMSHYWEIQHFMNCESSPLHGIKVGFATILIASMYQKVFNTDINTLNIRVKTIDEIVEHEKEIRRCYRSLSDEALTQYRASILNQEESEKRMENLFKNWERLKMEIGKLLSIAPDLKEILKKVKAPVDVNQLNIDCSQVYNALKYAKEVRNRYTILQLADQLDILEKYAKEISDELN